MQLGRVPTLQGAQTACPRPDMVIKNAEGRPKGYDPVQAIANNYYDLTEALEQVLLTQHSPIEKTTFEKINDAIEWLRSWKSHLPLQANPNHHATPAVVMLQYSPSPPKSFWIAADPSQYVL